VHHTRRVQGRQGLQHLVDRFGHPAGGQRAVRRHQRTQRTAAGQFRHQPRAVVDQPERQGAHQVRVRDADARLDHEAQQAQLVLAGEALQRHPAAVDVIPRQAHLAEGARTQRQHRCPPLQILHGTRGY
jgi:hypothetical protein